MFKKVKPILATTFMLSAFPLVALGQQVDAQGGALGSYLLSVLNFFTGTGLNILLGVGFLFFVWGMFKYFILGGTDEEKRNEGKDLLIYTAAGFVLIFVFWGIVNMVTNFVGIDDRTLQVDLPEVPSAR